MSSEGRRLEIRPTGHEVPLRPFRQATAVYLRRHVGGALAEQQAERWVLALEHRQQRLCCTSRVTWLGEGVFAGQHIAPLYEDAVVGSHRLRALHAGPVPVGTERPGFQDGDPDPKVFDFFRERLANTLDRPLRSVVPAQI